MKTNNVKVLLSAAIVLLIAWSFSACSKKSETPVVIKTALELEITTANNLLATTHEGTGTGEYLKGSQAILQAAITAAQAVDASTTVSQTDVTAATAQLTAAVTTYQAAIIVPIDPTDLVGQWTFDELTTAVVGTTVKDYSGLGHDGTIKAGADYFSTGPGKPWTGYVVTSNVPTQVADRYGNAGKALHFTAGANVDIPYSQDLNPAQISISLWAKADTLIGDTPGKYWANNYMVSMNRWNGYKFQLQDGPRAFFTAHVASCGCGGSDSTIYDRDMNAGFIRPLNAWYHLVVTFGGGHEIFYINGTKIYDWGSNNDGVPGTIVDLHQKLNTVIQPIDLVIGQDLPTAMYSNDSSSPFYVQYGAYFIGALDEVRIYKTVLSQSQVTSIYNIEKP